MQPHIRVVHLLQVSKQPGETIYKGHRSYDLMLNLQLGIRFTVGRITSKPQPTTLSDSEFRRTVRPSPAPQPSSYRTMRVFADSAFHAPRLPRGQIGRVVN